MDRIDSFFEAIKKDMTITLATASDGSVTMRLVSPVYYRGAVLLFTDPDSVKYRQMKANPHCCIAAQSVFAEAEAEFLGATMLERNRELRKVYCAKFPGAFDEGVAFGGRDAEFILLRPTRLKGWDFAEDTPPADGIPAVPFDIAL